MEDFTNTICEECEKEDESVKSNLIISGYLAIINFRSSGVLRNVSTAHTWLTD